MAKLEVNSVGYNTISKDYAGGRYETEYPYESNYDYVYVGGHVGTNLKEYDEIGVYVFPTADINKLYKSKVINSLKIRISVPYVEGGINYVSDPEKKIKISLFGSNTGDISKIGYFDFYSYVTECIDYATLDLTCSSNSNIYIELLDIFENGIKDALSEYQYVYVRLEEENGQLEGSWRLWKAAVLITEYQNAVSVIEIGYPNGVNVKNQSKITFMWSYSNNAGLKQTGYEIGWKTGADSDWNTIKVDSENKYHTFSENVFPAGDIEWRLRVTAADGAVTDYAVAKFLACGNTPAPVITNITLTAIPTITWECDDQDMFEVDIYKENGEHIHESGVMVEKNSVYTPNIMLKDGKYYVKMRVMNTYGYFTEWTTYSWILKTEKPDKPKAYVSYGRYATVIIEGDVTTKRTYVIRRKESEEDFSIIGVFQGIFIDYYCTTEKTEYALRAYDGGFTDSNAEEIKMDFQGIYLYEKGNEENCINIAMSTKEKFIPVSKTINKNTEYVQCIGRTYPVKECGRNIEEIVSTECFLFENQKDVLYGMYKGNADVIFKYGKEACIMDIASMEEANELFNKGYLVKLTFERLEENGVKLL